MENWYILSILKRKNKTPFIIERSKIDTLIVIDTHTESARFFIEEIGSLKNAI